MTTLDDLDLMDATTPANAGAPNPRKCYRHMWNVCFDRDQPYDRCMRCDKEKNEAHTRRNKNNKKRGTSDEATVARILGGRKVGPMGWAWDVEVEGYLRVQAKKLAAWPSMNEIIRWLDAIPASSDYMRAVTLADAPGAGTRTSRYIVIPLEEFARWHGRGE